MRRAARGRPWSWPRPRSKRSAPGRSRGSASPCLRESRPVLPRATSRPATSGGGSTRRSTRPRLGGAIGSTATPRSSARPRRPAATFELESFENRTRVLADRVAEVIAWRGRRLFEELKEQADIDSLTGLFSRRYLDRRLELEVEAARANEVPLSVALVDIDAFGEVNKRHGWPTGDRVLGEIAERVRAQRSLRRLGRPLRRRRDLRGHARRDRRTSCDRPRTHPLRHRIDPVHDHRRGPRWRSPRASGGAQLDGEGDSVAAVLERASARLLAAKGAGKNQVSV